MRASSENVYNTVIMQYQDASASEAEGAGFKFEDIETIVEKVDIGLPDEDSKEMFAQFPSCITQTLARYYALGLLWRSLKDVYKGEICIIGNPEIKPYDVCYIADEYTDMVGPVEVEQVVHLFSQTTGFVTEITPDLCLAANAITQMGSLDALASIAGISWGTTAGALPGFSGDVDTFVGRAGVGGVAVGAGIAASAGVGTAIGIGGSLSALSAAGVGATTIAGGVLATAALPILLVVGGIGLLAGGLFAIEKAISGTQWGHPIAASPVLYQGRQFIAAIPTDRIDINLIQQMGEYVESGAAGFSTALESFRKRLTWAPGRGEFRFFGDGSTI